MNKRLKEIIGILDADIYWKQCNFLQEDSDEIQFYSRDKCKNISFKELLLWYLPQLGSWQDEPNCNECDKDYKCTICEEGIADQKVKQIHYNLFLELIDIYAFYKSREDYSKYKYILNLINDNKTDTGTLLKLIDNSLLNYSITREEYIELRELV